MNPSTNSQNEKMGIKEHINRLDSFDSLPLWQIAFFVLEQISIHTHFESKMLELKCMNSWCKLMCFTLK